MHASENMLLNSPSTAEATLGVVEVGQVKVAVGELDKFSR